EATVNGRARCPVHVWHRASDETLLVDTANLVSARERERLVARLPEPVREEAISLLEQLALLVAQGPAEPVPDREGSGFADPDAWPVAVEIGPVLGKLAAFIRRFVVLPNAAADALAAWVVYTYVVKAFTVAPYIILRSPVMRCGK